MKEAGRMGAFTYPVLWPLSQRGSCAQSDNLSSNRPLLCDSALTWSRAIRVSPSIFPLLLLHSFTLSDIKWRASAASDWSEGSWHDSVSEIAA